MRITGAPQFLQEGDEIIIAPAQPGVVYVPVYDTSEVYGAWEYDDYPPYDWTWAGAPLADGYYWGTGAVIASGIWAWGNLDWRRHDIDIDVDKWNRINADRPKISNPKWEHNPVHRGAVPYKSEAVRNRFSGSEAAQQQLKDRSRAQDQRNVDSKLKQGAARDGKPSDARGSVRDATPKAKAKTTDNIKKAPGKSAKAKGKPPLAREKGTAKKSAGGAQPRRESARPSNVQRPAATGRPSAPSMRSAGGGRSMGRGGGGGRRGGGRR